MTSHKRVILSGAKDLAWDRGLFIPARFFGVPQADMRRYAEAKDVTQ